MGSGNAEPIGHFHIGDRRGRIARIHRGLQERILDQRTRRVSKEQHRVGERHHETRADRGERQTSAAMEHVKGTVSR